MTTQNDNPQKAALVTYQQYRADVARLLDFLDLELTKCGERAEAKPDDWTFPGTMGFIRTTLITLLEGISGIPRDRIEETLAEV